MICGGNGGSTGGNGGSTGGNGVIGAVTRYKIG